MTLKKTKTESEIPMTMRDYARLVDRIEALEAKERPTHAFILWGGGKRPGLEAHGFGLALAGGVILLIAILLIFGLLPESVFSF